MTYEEYLALVQSRYLTSKQNEELQAAQFYEEQFEVKWLASKLKQFSFVSLREKITESELREYSARCIRTALQEYKGLPRGFQNGVVSFNVLAGLDIDQSAIDFATKRPDKHFSAFEMPVLVDLNAQRIYYYSSTPMWGAIYYKHFREYIQKNFDFNS